MDYLKIKNSIKEIIGFDGNLYGHGLNSFSASDKKISAFKIPSDVNFYFDSWINVFVKTLTGKTTTLYVNPTDSII